MEAVPLCVEGGTLTVGEASPPEWSSVKAGTRPAFRISALPSRTCSQQMISVSSGTLLSKFWLLIQASKPLLGDRIRITRAQFWGTWVAQSVKRPTSAQVTISRSVSSSPASGSVLMAQSLLGLLSLSSSLSVPYPLSLSQNKYK